MPRADDSTHPDAPATPGRKGGRRRAFVIAAAVTAVLVLSGLAVARVVSHLRAAGEASRAAASVKTAVVQRGNLVSSVSASGYVTAAQTGDIRARVSGEVDAVLVSEGQWVSQGQVIVRLVVTDARSGVAEAQDTLGLAETRLAEARAAQKATSLQLNSQVESARYSLLTAESRLAQLVGGQRKEEIEQARASLRTAEANLEAARVELERLRRLYDEGAVPGQQVEDAANKYKTCLESKVAAEEKLKVATEPGTKDDIEAAKALVAQAKASYSAALESRQSTDVAEQVRTAEAQWRQAKNALDRAQKNLDSTVITAPISGTVVSVAVRPGDLVSPQSLCASLADTRRLQLEALVDETDIGLVGLGQRVQVTSDSLPDVTVPGTVTRISDVGQLKDNVVSFTVVIDLDTARLAAASIPRVGATADAEIVTMEKRNVLVLPRAAVVERRGRMMVQSLGVGQGGSPVEQGGGGAVADRQRTAGEPTEPVYKRVEVGATDGTRVEMLSGVEEGEVVLLPQGESTNAGSTGSGSAGQGGSNTGMRQFVPGVPGPGMMMLR